MTVGHKVLSAISVSPIQMAKEISKEGKEHKQLKDGKKCSEAVFGHCTHEVPASTATRLEQD